MKSNAYIHVNELKGLLEACEKFCAWCPATGVITGYAWDIRKQVQAVNRSIENAELQSVKAYYRKLDSRGNPENNVDSKINSDNISNHE